MVQKMSRKIKKGSPEIKEKMVIIRATRKGSGIFDSALSWHWKTNKRFENIEMSANIIQHIL